MSTDVSAKAVPEFNPVILRWTRNCAAVTIEGAAKRANVKPERVREWESAENQSQPTVRQARNLARLYGRSLMELFREDIPPICEPTEIPDFRLFDDAERDIDNPLLRSIQLWAETQRINALDLYEHVGEAPPDIPDGFFASVDQEVESRAASIRKKLEYPLEQQVELKRDNRRNIPIRLRQTIERIGVLTLRSTGILNIRVRGFCLASFPLPTIVFGSESYAAQSFTLLHELAHILLRQSAIVGPWTQQGGDRTKRRVENWCNRFAGAFLMPAEAVDERLRPSGTPKASIEDEVLSDLAEFFGVSEHAMLIRLVHMNRVSASFYWDVKKPIFDEQARHIKSFGRAPYYGSRYRNAQGDLYTSLVLEAWSLGRITGHNAAEYMGIKRLQHLNDIRDHFTI